METVYRWSRKVSQKYNLRLSAVYLVLRMAIIFVLTILLGYLYSWLFTATISFIYFFAIFWTFIWGYLGGIEFLLYRNDHTGD